MNIPVMQSMLKEKGRKELSMLELFECRKNANIINGKHE